MKNKHLQMYMRIAEAVAETSSAIRLKVGAVAVKNNMVIGTGYNGQPSGVEGDCETKVYASHPFLPVRDNDEFPYLCDDYKLPNGRKAKHKLITKDTVRHAEANLLLNLAKSTESSNGATIFCTHACCKFCAMDIVDAGISKVYYRHNYRSDEGVKYLLDNGVDVEQI